MNPRGPHLVSRHAGYLAYQFFVSACRQSDLMRKQRGACGIVGSVNGIYTVQKRYGVLGVFRDVILYDADVQPPFFGRERVGAQVLYGTDFEIIQVKSHFRRVENYGISFIPKLSFRQSHQAEVGHLPYFLFQSH